MYGQETYEVKKENLLMQPWESPKVAIVNMH